MAYLSVLVKTTTIFEDVAFLTLEIALRVLTRKYQVILESRKPIIS